MEEDRVRTVRRRTIPIASVIAAFALLAWATIPVGLVGWLSLVTQQAEVSQAQITWVPVAEHSGPLTRDASVAMNWTSQATVVAPQWDGLITSSSLSPGVSVASGQSLLTISGIQRIGFATPMPFYRPLTLGDTGSDVDALRGILTEEGFTPSGSGPIGPRDVRAIQGFAAKIGVPGARRQTSFDPAWVIYLPAKAVTPAKVQVLVGAPAPAAGQPLADLEPVLASAHIVERVDVAPGQDPSSIDLAAVSPLVAKPGEQLVVGGRTIALSDDATTVAASGLDAISAIAKQGAPITSATLLSRSSPGLWILPPGSLLTDRANQICALVRTGKRTHFVTVQVQSSEGPNAVVAGEFQPNDMVALGIKAGAGECH